MSRKLKPRQRSTSTSKRKSGGGTLLGMFLGLVLGVLAASGVVWYIYKTPPPFTNKSQPSPSAQPAGADGTPTPLALPGKPGDPVVQSGDKPRFDFYKILPGSAEAIPDPKSPEAKSGELKPADAAKAKAEKEDVLKEPVFLQAGSFQSASEADSQKAKLAMMGAEASVQQIMLQDKVWYRVRLGPFKRMDEVNSLRSDLAKQGVDANVVKKD